ncbi:MAG: hypothetical protein QXP81_10455 [Nitrososphaerota archaeon]|nr:hypothetical protein [Candidatus Calditenuis fumarioli]
MGIAVYIPREKAASLLKELIARGWSISSQLPLLQFEKVIDGSLIWFGYYDESVGCYRFCSDVISDDVAGEERSRLHREGVRKLQKEVEEICRVLGIGFNFGTSFAE